MDSIFSRNIPALTPEQQKALERSHILIVGCGGLGGHLLMNLGRAGVGEITVVDGDTFEESNLNRQALSSRQVLGINKALAARSAVCEINPDLVFHGVDDFMTEANVAGLVEGKDLVLDALDRVKPRLWLEKACEEKGVPIVHGAVLGWSVQAGVVMPGSGMLSRLYRNAVDAEDKSCLSPTPAFCAAVQSAEAIKLLCGLPSQLEGNLLLADLKTMEMQTVEI